MTATATQTTTPTTALATNSAGPLASRGQRLAATLIDMLLVPTLSLLLVLITGATEDAEDYTNLARMGMHIFGLAVVSYLILNGYTLSKHGQTLGKKALSIAIVNANTAELSAPTPVPLWKLIALRALFFPLLFVLPLWPLTLLPLLDQAFIFSKQRRCLHDLVAGTCVIQRPKRV